MLTGTVLIIVLASAATICQKPQAAWLLALFFGALVYLIPWNADGLPPVFRAGLTVAALWGSARLWDLFCDRRHYPLGRRLWHVFGLIDTRKTSHIRAACDHQAWAKSLAYTIAALVSLLTIRLTSVHLTDSGLWIVRWTCGALFFYCLAEAVEGFVRGFYRLMGIRFPKQHRTPILSRTLQEFWGFRWNRAVGTWLHHHCFLPWAHQNKPTVGLICAFTVSALFHAYFTWVAVGLPLALSMGSFFLFQGTVMLCERKLHVTHWAPLPTRLWTISLILVPSPLFVEPILRMLSV